MRRLLASLSLVSLLTGLVGCHEIHGICDCDIPGHRCCYQDCAWHHMAPGVAPAGVAAPAPLKAEPIPAKPMPADVAPAPAKDGM